MTMEFYLGKKRILLAGAHSTCPNSVSFHSLQRLAEMNLVEAMYHLQPTQSNDPHISTNQQKTTPDITQKNT